jgi:hypothetical protein
LSEDDGHDGIARVKLMTESVYSTRYI